MSSVNASEPITVDIAVVGAGPVGLYAAYYAGFRGFTCAVMDSLTELGGQVSALYPEKLIEDVAGLPSVRGTDLVDGLRSQAARFDPRYVLGTTARSVVDTGDGLLVHTDTDTTVRCGAMIIAGGIGRFTPRPLPAGEDFLGRGLSYFVTDPAELAGMDVLVVGGGDSAFDWAIAARVVGAKVTLVHRRDRFRAHAASVSRAAELGVEILTHHEVVALEGTDRVAGARVMDMRTQEERALQAQHVIAALGFTANLSDMQSWGLTFRDRHVVVDSTMSTGVKRIWAAGDLTDYPGKVRLISVGFGEAATAVNNAAVFLDPTLDIFPGHSTENSTLAGASAAASPNL
ncbi:NAD(P)/FAD-dependent oxidoreductase [Nocardioides sp. 31GB23]|uniref:NAD(P)/FAD-dependent oxidoreductase n=1 Tax=Nocardioides sp. 31GB23 TaxID=3156065 RepID=UPI0032B02177